ncbi:MAG: bacteriophage Gp15 family protein [Lachnospiraceae bacterium]|nr:bacteriophage Gp15 family protein [Lachnospiraceae bacterium]
MNILLLNGLPEDYEGIPISADYRNMINVDLILHGDEGNETERTIAALHQLYPQIPADIAKAVEGLTWFFSRGKIESNDKKNDNNTKKASVRAFSFEQDADLIYAAFYATYNISLSTVDFLHWWEFLALFEGLPETTLIQRVMYWRTANLSDLPKPERKHIQKMCKIFALKEPDKIPMSVEEINQDTKDRVARRFAEAQAMLGG